MLKSAITLLSGTGIFIYAIYLINLSLSEEVVNGSKKFFQKLNNPFYATIAGLVSSMITQSSSAINSIAVQLADKRLIKDNNKYLVVVGTNVGTTVTAYMALISELKFSYVFLLLLPIFGILLTISKKELTKKISMIVCSFSLIFVGINTISSAIPGILEKLDISLFLNSNEISLLLLSSAITAVCQSSSIVSLIIVMLGQNGFIGIEKAIFMIMGANVGTCSTALISALGKSRPGKSVANFNLIYNVLGVLLHVFCYYTGLLDWFLNISVSTDTKIALYHTFFNVSSIPFIIPLFIKDRTKKQPSV